MLIYIYIYIYTYIYIYIHVFAAAQLETCPEFIYSQLGSSGCSCFNHLIVYLLAQQSMLVRNDARHYNGGVTPPPLVLAPRLLSRTFVSPLRR